MTIGRAPLVQLGRPDRAPTTMVELTIDGQRTQVAEGTTILTACAGLGTRSTRPPRPATPGGWARRSGTS